MKKINVSVFAAAVLALAVSSSLAIALAESSNNPFGLSVSVGVLRTDNRDQIEDGIIVNDKRIEKDDDTEISVSAKISYDHMLPGRYMIKLSYEPFYTYYDNPRPNSEEEEWSHNFNGRFTYFWGDRASITLKDDYWWSGNSDWYYGDDYEYLKNMDDSWSERSDDYYENRFSGDLVYNLSEVDYTVLSSKWRVKRYDDSEVASSNDEDEFNVRLALMRKLSRFFQLGIFADYTMFDKDSVNDIDLGVDYVTVGFQGGYDVFGDQALVINGSIGYNMMSYDDSDMDDKDMLGDSSLELVFTPQTRFRGSVGLRYGNVYSTTYPFTSEDTLAVFGTARYILGSNNRFAVGGQVEYRMRDYDLEDLDPDVEEVSEYYMSREELASRYGDANRDSIWLRLYVDCHITSSMDATVFYTHESVDSNFCSEYDENIFGVRLSYKFL